MIKRILVVLTFICGGFIYSSAQTPNTLTTTVIIPAVVDSTKVGVSIFELLSKPSAGGGSVEINQPNYMDNTLHYYKAANRTKKRNGFRIRLFFDNKQTSRGESENIVNNFKENFPIIPAYRSYTNPYFKVVVGDYRTKSDAIKALQNVKRVFPNAIIVKEQIEYPAI